MAGSIVQKIVKDLEHRDQADRVFLTTSWVRPLTGRKMISEPGCRKSFKSSTELSTSPWNTFRSPGANGLRYRDS